MQRFAVSKRTTLGPASAAALLIATAMGVLGATGCAQIERTRQCNDLIGAIEGGASTIKVDYAKDLPEQAGKIDELAGKVGAVKLEDPRLVALSKDYRAWLTDLATLVRDYEVLDNPADLEKRSRETVDREKELTGQINSYCKNGK